jgi:YggT family protein
MFTKEDAQNNFSITFLFYSPILAFLVLDAFTSTAAALPAELPAAYQETTSASSTQSNLTTTQGMWKRRLCSNTSKKSDSSR